MNNPFATCCDVGTHEHDTPMPISGRLESVDWCLAHIVGALNAANMPTVWSCCGHGKMDASIGLADGRVLVIKEAPHE
jgi:hypothetical protein